MYWSLENVPWTNLHDLNLDWIVNTMKQTVEQWIAYRTEMNQNFANFTTQINDDFDAFTAQINEWKNDVNSDFADLQTYVQNYFDNLDLNESTRYVINQMIASGEFIQVLNPSIVSATEAWLANHVTPTSPVVDDTLTISGAAADAKVTGTNIDDIKTTLSDYDIFDYTINNLETTNNTNNGVTYNWDKNVCTLSGTATANSFSNFLVNVPAPKNKNVTVFCDTSKTGIAIRLITLEGSTITRTIDITSGRTVYIPATTDYIIARIQVTSGTVTNTTVKVRIITETPLSFIASAKEIIPYISNSTVNLNSIVQAGVYTLDTTYTLSNSPVAQTYGFLVVQPLTYSSNFVMQYLLIYGTNEIYSRKLQPAGWIEWEKISPSLPINYRGLPVGTDFNTLSTKLSAGFHVISSDRNYVNCPVDVGFLMNLVIDNIVLQIVYSWTGPTMYKRRALNGTFSNWELIAGGGANEYTFNNYNNTYNVTATPTITTDTNNYLASTNDNTDRTNDIATMLTTNKICRLGPGVFYVENLNMPANTAIYGCGYATQLILPTGDNKHIIKMNSYCTLSDVRLSGNMAFSDLSPTLGTRNGIVWAGNYTQDPTSGNQPQTCFLNNINIDGFNGSGIYAYDTGYGTYNQIEGININIARCRCAINLYYWTEFHKFTNVNIVSCYYGAINNGGNNTFINCCFSMCEIEMLLDNENNQSPNNSHGTIDGCIFAHAGLAEYSGSNNGLGVKMLNCNNGQIFSNCEFGYAGIETTNSSGVIFNGNNMIGTNITITITNGGLHMFNANVFQTQPVKTISGNNNVKFINCFDRNGTVVE